MSFFNLRKFVLSATVHKERRASEFLYAEKICTNFTFLLHFRSISLRKSIFKRRRLRAIYSHKSFSGDYILCRKAYDSVWHDDLWCKFWHMGVKGGCGV